MVLTIPRFTKEKGAPITPSAAIRTLMLLFTTGFGGGYSGKWILFAEGSGSGGGGRSGGGLIGGGGFWSSAAPSNVGLAIAITAMAGLALAATVVYSRRGSLKSPWSRRRRKHALLPKQWKSLFLADGKLCDSGVKFLKKVRSGGVDPTIRAEVWPFLLGMYDVNSSKEERDSIKIQNRKQYDILRKQCKQIMRRTTKSHGPKENAGYSSEFSGEISQVLDPIIEDAVCVSTSLPNGREVSVSQNLMEYVSSSNEKESSVTENAAEDAVSLIGPHSSEREGFISETLVEELVTTNGSLSNEKEDSLSQNLVEETVNLKGSLSDERDGSVSQNPVENKVNVSVALSVQGEGPISQDLLEETTTLRVSLSNDREPVSQNLMEKAVKSSASPSQEREDSVSQNLLEETATVKVSLSNDREPVSQNPVEKEVNLNAPPSSEREDSTSERLLEETAIVSGSLANDKKPVSQNSVEKDVNSSGPPSNEKEGSISQGLLEETENASGSLTIDGKPVTQNLEEKEANSSAPPSNDKEDSISLSQLEETTNISGSLANDRKVVSQNANCNSSDEPVQSSSIEAEDNVDKSEISFDNASAGDTESSISDSSEFDELELLQPFLPSFELEGTDLAGSTDGQPSSSEPENKAKKLHSDEDFTTWQRIIRLDAVRANSEWVIYSPSQANVTSLKARRLAESVGLKDYDHLEACQIFHAARLVAILEAYAVYDPEIGYCQGMSDLLSPIVSVMEDDDDAFWCFVRFMKKARHNFRLDEVGIKRQLNIVSKIIKCKDSHLYSHLKKLQAEDCFFVYRMVVVLFRRELNFDQTLCMWEVIWADQAAIRAGFAKSAWSRMRMRAPPTDDLLLYAIAACVLQRRKLIIEKYSSMEEIMRECNSMAGQLDVWKLLDDAHDLVVTLHDKI